MELLELFAPLGVGGILGGVIFYFHRLDTNRWLEVERGRTDRILQVITENTAALTKLCNELRQDGHEGA